MAVKRIPRGLAFIIAPAICILFALPSAGPGRQFSLEHLPLRLAMGALLGLLAGLVVWLIDWFRTRRVEREDESELS